MLEDRKPIKRNSLLQGIRFPSIRIQKNSNKGQRYGTLSSIEALFEVYLSASKPQSLRDLYSRATKIDDTEYKPARFYDVMRIC
jgi:hypothetical protein